MEDNKLINNVLDILYEKNRFNLLMHLKWHIFHCGSMKLDTYHKTITVSARLISKSLLYLVLYRALLINNYNNFEA